MEGTHAGAVDEKLQSCGNDLYQKFMEDCFLWEALHAGVEEECEEFSP